MDYAKRLLYKGSLTVTLETEIEADRLYTPADLAVVIAKGLRKFRHVSASQITSYRECKRKWFFRYILGLAEPKNAIIKKAIKRGTDIHARVEVYLPTGELPAKGDPYAAHLAALAPTLPAPGREDVLCEYELCETLDVVDGDGTPRTIILDGIATFEGGPRFVGFIDVLVDEATPGVGDVKSKSDRRRVKKAHELAVDVQLICYGHAVVAVGDAVGDPVEKVRFWHSTVITKGTPKAAAVEVEVSRDEIEAQWNGPIMGTVRDMQATALIPRVEEVEPTLSACPEYMGCGYFNSICPLSRAQKMKAAFTPKFGSPTTENGGSKMSKLLGGIQNQAKAAGVPTGGGSKLAAAAPAGGSKLAPAKAPAEAPKAAPKVAAPATLGASGGKLAGKLADAKAAAPAPAAAAPKAGGSKLSPPVAAAPAKAASGSKLTPAPAATSPKGAAVPFTPLVGAERVPVTSCELDENGVGATYIVDGGEDKYYRCEYKGASKGSHFFVVVASLDGSPSSSKGSRITENAEAFVWALPVEGDPTVSDVDGGATGVAPNDGPTRAVSSPEEVEAAAVEAEAGGKKGKKAAPVEAADDEETEEAETTVDPVGGEVGEGTTEAPKICGRGCGKPSHRGNCSKPPAEAAKAPKAPAASKPPAPEVKARPEANDVRTLYVDCYPVKGCAHAPVMLDDFLVPILAKAAEMAGLPDAGLVDFGKGPATVGVTIDAFVEGDTEAGIDPITLPVYLVAPLSSRFAAVAIEKLGPYYPRIVRGMR